jgi:hypothetical protein
LKKIKTSINIQAYVQQEQKKNPFFSLFEDFFILLLPFYVAQLSITPCSKNSHQLLEVYLRNNYRVPMKKETQKPADLANHMKAPQMQRTTN